MIKSFYPVQFYISRNFAHTVGDIEQGMPSSPLDSSHDWTTSGVACHHGPWATRKVRLHLSWQCHYLSWNAHTVRLRWVWHAIIAHEKHRLSDDIGGGMLSSHINSTHYWTTLGMAWYRRSLTPHMIAWRRAWHAHMALGKHTRSDDVWRGMPLSPLGKTHGRTT